MAASHAPSVVTPAYDGMDDQQRHDWAAEHPDSYLHALPAATSGITSADLQACRAAVDRLVADQRFQHLATPFVMLYQLTSGTHTQTALLCDLDVAVVDRGQIVGHEHTRREREDDLVDYLRTVQVASSPVCVMHARSDELTRVIGRATGSTPDIRLESEALTQRVWVVTDPVTSGLLLDAASSVGPLVIIDGHHRTAAARRFADEATHPSGHRLLVALFPQDGVQVREFNRVVAPAVPAGDGVEAALRGAGLEVTRLDGPEHPQHPRRLAVVSDGRWWRVAIPDGLVPDDPVRGLDVALLHDLVLAPLFGVEDARTDPRLGFVPGTRGLGALAAAAGPDGVGFALHPIDTDQIMHIALSGQTLPPKSTYLDPKARSGLLMLPRR